MKTSELEGAELDYWVAKAEGHAEIELSRFTRGGEKRLRCEVVLPGEDGQTYWTEYEPSSDWERAGPIIEREGIGLAWDAGEWMAAPSDDRYESYFHLQRSTEAMTTGNG